MYLPANANQADEVPHHWRHQSNSMRFDRIEIGRIGPKNTTHLCICLRGWAVRRKQVSPEVHERQKGRVFRYSHSICLCMPGIVYSFIHTYICMYVCKSGEMQKNPSHCSTLSQVQAARSVWLTRFPQHWSPAVNGPCKGQMLFIFNGLNIYLHKHMYLYVFPSEI